MIAKTLYKINPESKIGNRIKKILCTNFVQHEQFLHDQNKGHFLLDWITDLRRGKHYIPCLFESSDGVGWRSLLCSEKYKTEN